MVDDRWSSGSFADRGCVQRARLGGEMGLMIRGNVSLNGTKIKADASKHTALSYAYVSWLEEQLKREVKVSLLKWGNSTWAYKTLTEK